MSDFYFHRLSYTMFAQNQRCHDNSRTPLLFWDQMSINFNYLQCSFLLLVNDTIFHAATPTHTLYVDAMLIAHTVFT